MSKLAIEERRENHRQKTKASALLSETPVEVALQAEVGA
jgi:hypothetical protein